MAVAGLLCCIECGRETAVLERGWRALLNADDDGDEAEIVVYCPDCAHREFDDD